MSIELEFKKFLLAKTKNLNEERIVRCSKGEKPAHLRFYSDCGIANLEEFIHLLENLDLTWLPNDSFTGSPSYKGQGFDVTWKNSKIGVLLAISNTGVERKKYTPQNFKLNGLTFTDPQIFRNTIVNQLTLVEKDTDLRNFLISLLDNLEGKDITLDSSKHKKNLNKITSDFGEILCAYQSCLNQHTIQFPFTSNNNLTDYYENSVSVSAKGRKSGGKVNLVNYKDSIAKILGDPIYSENLTAKFLYALASHNKQDFFSLASQLSPEVKCLQELVGGFQENVIKSYIKKTKYDNFYKFIDKSFGGIGVPLKSKDNRPRDLWKQGDTNPFYFTLNTIVHRFWGSTEQGIDLISPLVVQFLKSAKFKHLDVIEDRVVIKEVLFSDVARWQTVYWSRSTAAWHNWMAVEPVKDKK